jgi:hypothetical protein
MRISTSVLIVVLATLAAACARYEGKEFATPEAAVDALVKATQSKDGKKLLAVLGPEAKPLVDSGDPVADQNSRDWFVAAYAVGHSLDKSEPDSLILEVGEDKWPFPIPLASRDGKWHWDGATGVEEMINRRVGRNELMTIQSCLAFVDAQREYYARNEQKNTLQHYADKLISSKGKKDGLYWPTTGNERESPLGWRFAKARAEGYLKPDAPQPEPYHGYFYRLLTRQGPGATGGAYDYTVNDVLLGGFGLIAFPAEYGKSGVMTFIVNHDGVVYSRDLGHETSKTAMAIGEFNPDTNWKKEEEIGVLAGR